MTKTLRPLDVLALGFMTFALFLGAGNVIFPPSAGLAAGEQMLPTAIGFLLTAIENNLIAIEKVPIVIGILLNDLLRR